jgi:hypothetical protein
MAPSCGTVVVSGSDFRPSTSASVAFSSASVGFGFACGVLMGPRLPERPINYNRNARGEKDAADEEGEREEKEVVPRAVVEPPSVASLEKLQAIKTQAWSPGRR